MFEKLTEAFISLFVVIEPFGLVPIFLMLAKDESSQDKLKIAVKAVLIASIIIISFAFLGTMLFDYLQISEPAFRIAGGLLLLISSTEMVIGKHTGTTSTTEAEDKEAQIKDDISVFPLAIPLISGPGAMTTIIILMRKNEGDTTLKLLIIAVLFLVMVITFLCLLLAQPLSKILGITGSNVITRVSGILLAALAVQFIIDGIKLTFFTNPNISLILIEKHFQQYL